MKRFVEKAWEIYRPFRWKLLVVFLFIAVAQALGLMQPYLQGMLIDCLIQGGSMGFAFQIIGAAFFLFILRNVVVGYYREMFEITHLDFSIPRRASRLTMETVFKLSVGQHIAQNSAIKESTVSKGQHALTAFAYTIMYDVLPIAVQIVFMVIALLIMSWPLGCALLLGLTAYVACVVGGNYRVRKPLQHIEEMQQQQARLRREIYQNAELVLFNSQAARAVDEADQGLEKINNEHTRVWTAFVKWAFARNAIIGVTRLIVMGLGVWYVYRGVYTPGALVVFWAWSVDALAQAGSVGQLQRRLVDLYASIQKYFEMLGVEPSVTVVPNPVHPERFRGAIEFRNVTFQYPRRVRKDQNGEGNGFVTQEAALRGVSFKITPGTTTAFVGESGSGKTTTVFALLRAEDVTHGQITVDGHDLRVLDLEHFRRSVGLVEQHVPLFDDTLAYNITYGLSGPPHECTEERLAAVSEMACLDRFFDRLEHGFQTFIGERGIKLSGGERQRVGIARALIKDAPILIFDEATSNLDAENEALIRSSIEKASQGRTTIIIAHRLSTVRHADKIVVFDKGSVVGEGSHDELMRTCPEYQRLVQHQMHGS